MGDVARTSSHMPPCCIQQELECKDLTANSSNVFSAAWFDSSVSGLLNYLIPTPETLFPEPGNRS